MYTLLIRPLLFLFDPERIHTFSLKMLRALLSLPLVPSLFRAMFCRNNPKYVRKVFGLTFNNPVGLAAGFDKDGIVGDKWKHLGFGFIELGTVTPRPQIGNTKPRLFRLPTDKAVINRMGFNNGGVESLLARLKRMDRKGIVIGANIGKNKDTPNERAVDDYVICFEKLFDYVDYFVVNVSSPNTPNLRALQDKEPLTQLLSTLQRLNHARPAPKPLLLKIAPDLNQAQLDDIIEVAQATKLDGLIANNTTISRANLQTSSAAVKQIGAGGLSGAPVTERSLEVLGYIHKKSKGGIPLIGVGGIMTPTDAQNRLNAGASLIQSYTGFVYNGPAFPKHILQQLS